MSWNWYCTKETKQSANRNSGTVNQFKADEMIWQDEVPTRQANSSVTTRSFTSGSRRGDSRTTAEMIRQRPADFFYAFILFWTAGTPAISVQLNRFSKVSNGASEGSRLPWLAAGTWFAPLLILVVLTLILMQSSAVREKLDYADALWGQGRKDEAGVIYQSVVVKSGLFIPQEQQGVVYGRAIDYLTQNNRRQEARRLFDQLSRRSQLFPLQIESSAGRGLMEEVRKEWIAAKKKNKADIVLSASKLSEVDDSHFYNAAGFYHIFHSNYIETDLMFTGTITFLRGVVDSIEMSPENETAINFVTNQSGQKGVRCLLRPTSENSDQVKNIKPGDYVKIRGRCEGRSSLGIVVMSECDLLIANE